MKLQFYRKYIKMTKSNRTKQVLGFTVPSEISDRLEYKKVYKVTVEELSNE